MCMECMKRSLYGCVCELLYWKKAARMMGRSGATLMSWNWMEEVYGGSLGRELSRSEERKVAEKRGGVNEHWMERFVFFGREDFWLSSCLILEEHIGVRKLILSGDFCECKV